MSAFRTAFAENSRNDNLILPTYLPTTHSYLPPTWRAVVPKITTQTTRNAKNNNNITCNLTYVHSSGRKREWFKPDGVTILLRTACVSRFRKKNKKIHVMLVRRRGRRRRRPRYDQTCHNVFHLPDGKCRRTVFPPFDFQMETVLSKIAVSRRIRNARSYKYLLHQTMLVSIHKYRL